MPLNLFDIFNSVSANLALKSVESVGQPAYRQPDFESVKHNNKSKNTAGGKKVGVKSAVKPDAAAKGNNRCRVGAGHSAELKECSDCNPAAGNASFLVVIICNRVDYNLDKLGDEPSIKTHKKDFHSFNFSSSENIIQLIIHYCLKNCNRYLLKNRKNYGIIIDRLLLDWRKMNRNGG